MQTDDLKAYPWQS